MRNVARLKMGSRALSFPEKNGPIPWPRFSLDQVLRPIPVLETSEFVETLAA